MSNPSDMARCGRTAAVVALASLTLAGCSEPPGASHFPLESGRQWTYRLSSEWENSSSERETVVLRNLGRDGAVPSGSAWHRRSETGLDYWLRADASGIYRVAAKTDLEAEPTPDAQPRYVLKAPIAVGTSWQATTTSYLLRRRNDFPPEIRHGQEPVAMTYTIAALDERVQTPAGVFEHCLRVQGAAKMKLFADAVGGWQDLPLMTTEWYCPGVGLVKVERREPANSTFLVGGTMALELTEWQ
ncbi:MAG: hypothetical protein AB9M60_10945 [Leptothrix sp. (in: b-proteobacteria)]